MIVATSTDQNIDQLIAVHATTLARTNYRYSADIPIQIDQLFVADATDQLWLSSHGTLFHVVLAVDEEA